MGLHNLELPILQPAHITPGIGFLFLMTIFRREEQKVCSTHISNGSTGRVENPVEGITGW